MKKKFLKGIIPIMLLSSDLLPEKAVFIQSLNLFSEIIESQPVRIPFAQEDADTAS